MPDGANPRTDIGLGLFLVVACALVLWETRDIPPGSFEPLGSAPVPQVTAGLIILLTFVIMGRAFAVLRRGVTSGETPADYELRPLDAAAVLGLTVLYVLAMAYRVFDFAIITTIYLTAAIGFLVRFRLRLMPWVVLVALVTGYGCLYVFTRVFVVDLPGL